MTSTPTAQPTPPTTGVPGAEEFSPDWLALRERADARARSTELVDLLAPQLSACPAAEPVVVHDLGCGTGSMGRWLAPRLPVPQHWVLHDRDPGLLERASSGLPSTTPGGHPVTAAGHRCDVTAITADDLAGADLVTTSALLDLLTAAELDAVAAACAGARCAALLTLSVAGRVQLGPADPLDAAIAAAFDDHQRRAVRRRRLLGPEAVATTAGAFTRYGAIVEAAPSPWRLGPDDAELAVEWLRGWVAAAAEQRPDLPTGRYLERRLEQAAAGLLTVTVHHADLLVHWPAA